MPQQKQGSFIIQDEDLKRSFVIPVSPEVFNSYTPTVQNRIVDYFINSTVQGEQLNSKGGLFERNRNNVFNPTPPPLTDKLQQSPYTPPAGPGPAQLPSTAAAQSAPFRFMENVMTPPLENLSGLLNGVMSPIKTATEVIPNARKFNAQQEAEIKQQHIGPVEATGRRVAASLSPIIGPGAVKAGTMYESGDIPASIGRTIGEAAGALIPGGVGEAGRGVQRFVQNVGKEAKFSRTIGNPSHPELNTEVARTGPEAMEERKGVTGVGNAIDSAIADTATMHRFNADRVQALSDRLRELPTQVEPTGNPAGVRTTVQAQTIVGRIPKGQPGGGRMQRQSSLTPDSYSLLGMAPGPEASAALRQLPRDGIQNIISDVRSGVIPQDMFKQYFVAMVKDMVEGQVPNAKLNINPASRAAAEISHVSGGGLMRELEQLSRDSYQTSYARGSDVTSHRVEWNRLDDLATAAGVDAKVMTDNLGAVASQLEQLQATGKLGPKVDRINLAMSVPIESPGAGAGGLGKGTKRVFGANPVVAGIGTGAGVGGAAGYAVGGPVGGLVGAGTGAAAGSTLPTVLAWAATSPRVMFTLRQFLRLSGTPANEFSAAKRLIEVVREEENKSLTTAEKNASVGLVVKNK